MEVAPLAYEFPVDAAIKALKFQRRLYYAPAFGELLCKACALLPDDIDAIVPVPLHWRRRWFRGFNQAHEIGKLVAKKLGVPIRFIGIGEAAEDLDEVRAGPFIDALIGVGGEAAPS